VAGNGEKDVREREKKKVVRIVVGVKVRGKVGAVRWGGRRKKVRRRGVIDEGQRLAG